MLLAGGFWFGSSAIPHINIADRVADRVSPWVVGTLQDLRKRQGNDEALLHESLGAMRADSIAYEHAVRPIQGALMELNGDSALTRQVAVAVIQEAQKPQTRRAGITAELIVGVIHIENTTLKVGARSSVGAVGLMQVMPMHHGMAGCPTQALTHVTTNICHGVGVLRDVLRATKGDMTRALLAYNGCVTGSNTPDCHRYPAKVAAALRRVRARMSREEKQQQREQQLAYAQSPSQ